MKGGGGASAPKAHPLDPPLSYHQAVVVTTAGDSSTQRGGGIGKSLGWNFVSPSNQVTVFVVSTANKHVHISFYGTIIGFARTCVCVPKTHYVQTLCYLCGFFLCPGYVGKNSGPRDQGPDQGTRRNPNLLGILCTS